MRNVLIILNLILMHTLVWSQSVDKGRVQIKLGTGVFVGKATASNRFTINQNTALNSSTFDIGLKQQSLAFVYHTHQQFALGINIYNHSYVGDSSNYQAGSLGALVQYYFVNKPKWNVFLETTATTLDASWDNRSEYAKASLKGKGSIVGLSLGVNKYFGKIFGLYLQSGFMGQTIRINQFSYKGEKKNFIGNIKTEDLKYLFNGGFIQIGLVFKLNNKTPKSGQ